MISLWNTDLFTEHTENVYLWAKMDAHTWIGWLGWLAHLVKADLLQEILKHLSGH